MSMPHSLGHPYHISVPPLPISCLLGGTKWWLKHLFPYHPPRWEIQTVWGSLFLIWSKYSCCRHLRSHSVSERFSLSLCPHSFYNNFLIKFKKLTRCMWALCTLHALCVFPVYAHMCICVYFMEIPDYNIAQGTQLSLSGWSCMHSTWGIFLVATSCTTSCISLCPLFLEVLIVRC